MDTLKTIIAKNIQELRLAADMTQAELAARLNYSDKAVSKWERGESIPDVQVLKSIADIFDVTVDYLLKEDHEDRTELPRESKRIIRRNRLVISLLATSVVWLLATIAFVLGELISKGQHSFWLAYIVAIPVSAIVLLVFNSIWGKGAFNYVLISVLLWSTLLSICLILSISRIWILFVIGIPAQIMIFLSS
ncbi:MAG: helix-turn-helix transcriptional regulator, partial [Clostridia bacterium]|nr:helix-turn-helix transcriptional regulator [Clostridia bacterium]